MSQLLACSIPENLASKSSGIRPVKDIQVLLHPYFICALGKHTVTHLQTPAETNLCGSFA